MKADSDIASSSVNTIMTGDVIGKIAGKTKVTWNETASGFYYDFLKFSIDPSEEVPLVVQFLSNLIKIPDFN